MKNKFKTPKKGFVFRDGKLYEFKRDSISVLKAWPPVVYQKTRKKPFWHYGRIEKMQLSYQALKYSICTSKEIPYEKMFDHVPEAWPPPWLPALSKFYEAIPVNVREIMLFMTSGAIDTQWDVCAFFARCPDADEIIKNCPVIGFMLANLPVFRKGTRRRWDVARRLAKKKRREILRHLGWPDSEAMAKILSKIPLEACDKKVLLQLRMLVNKNPEIIKPLSHVDMLSRQSLGILCMRKHRARAGWGLIDEMGDIPANESFGVYSTFADTVRMEELLRIPASQIRSLEHLERRHTRAVKLLNKKKYSEASAMDSFPPPPVPVPPSRGDFEISPIQTPMKLFEEGCDQSNCVYAYCEEVMASGGGIYFYSMTKPERATVRIDRMPGRKGYVIREIKGTDNCDVSSSTVAAVERWLLTYSETAMPAELYEELRRIDMLPGLNVPRENIGDLEICQERDSSLLVDVLSDFNVKLENELMQRIILGKTYVFRVNDPDEALLLVSRDGHCEWTYDCSMKCGNLCYGMERLIDLWLNRLAQMNYLSDIPGQMWIEFEQQELAAHG